MSKSAKEQLLKEKKEKLVVLEKDFAGIKAGNTMFVATPKIIDSFIKRIAFGQTITIPELRKALANQHYADATCPVSTSIFIRIVAQAAIDELEEGKGISEVTPFWRVLTSEDKLTKKLTMDVNRVDELRRNEQTT